MHIMDKQQTLINGTAETCRGHNG